MKTPATRLCEKMYWLIIIGLLIANGLNAQSFYAEGNNMKISVATSSKYYEFTTKCMSARLNNEQGRFEFVVPVSNFESGVTPTDLNFLRKLIGKNGILRINASLPDCDDATSDITYLNAFSTLQLPSEVKIGDLQMVADLILCNIKISEFIAFDFDCMIDTRRMPMEKIVGEKILEIRIEANDTKLIKVASL